MLNDNGRSYAPDHLQALGVAHVVAPQQDLPHAARTHSDDWCPDLPRVGKAAYLGIDGFTSVVREMVTPHTFFENLGVRYIGPIDGHNIESIESDAAAAPRSGTDPSSCTCSPRRAAATNPRSTTT